MPTMEVVLVIYLSNVQEMNYHYQTSTDIDECTHEQDAGVSCLGIKFYTILAVWPLGGRITTRKQQFLHGVSQSDINSEYR